MLVGSELGLYQPPCHLTLVEEVDLMLPPPCLAILLLLTRDLLSSTQASNQLDQCKGRRALPTATCWTGTSTRSTAGDRQQHEDSRKVMKAIICILMACLKNNSQENATLNVTV